MPEMLSQIGFIEIILVIIIVGMIIPKIKTIQEMFSAGPLRKVQVDHELSTMKDEISTTNRVVKEIHDKQDTLVKDQARMEGMIQALIARTAFEDLPPDIKERL